MSKASGIRPKNENMPVFTLHSVNGHEARQCHTQYAFSTRNDELNIFRQYVEGAAVSHQGDNCSFSTLNST